MALSVSVTPRPQFLNKDMGVEDGKGGIIVVLINPENQQPEIRQSAKSSGEPWCSMGKGLIDLADGKGSTPYSTKPATQVIYGTMKKAITTSIMTPIFVKVNFGWNNLIQTVSTVTGSFYESTMIIRDVLQNFIFVSICQRISYLKEMISAILNYEQIMNFLTTAANFAWRNFFQHYGRWNGVVDYVLYALFGRWAPYLVRFLQISYRVFYNMYLD
jgi:hypothetical protein